MTGQELIDLCLTFPCAYEDYPVDNVTPVIKHSINKKMFALVGETDGRPSINLKCDPVETDFLRQIYRDVLPGYHMNKTHWNTVVTGGDVLKDDLRRMIEISYNLVKPKEKRRKNAE